MENLCGQLKPVLFVLFWFRLFVLYWIMFKKIILIFSGDWFCTRLQQLWPVLLPVGPTGTLDVDPLQQVAMPTDEFRVIFRGMVSHKLGSDSHDIVVKQSKQVVLSHIERDHQSVGLQQAKQVCQLSQVLPIQRLHALQDEKHVLVELFPVACIVLLQHEVLQSVVLDAAISYRLQQLLLTEAIRKVAILLL